MGDNKDNKIADLSIDEMEHKVFTDDTIEYNVMEKLEKEFPDINMKEMDIVRATIKYHREEIFIRLASFEGLKKTAELVIDFFNELHGKVKKD